MQLPHSDDLEVGYLSRLFDNTSECYKFFWFKAIVKKVLEGKSVLTYEELIDEMIADAWYMVTAFHLNLGPNDTLEKVVNHIKEISGMDYSEKKEKVIEYLRACEDSDVKKLKRVLTLNVPYRLQAPFMPSMKGDEWKVSEPRLAEKINEIRQNNRLLYYFSKLNGMDTTIIIDPDWEKYIHKNQEIIKGWLQYNMILYLQKRNPNVPGISDKLVPPMERKLEKVKKYWKLLISIEPVREIYHDEIITSNDISIDHFVPWSYVAHDEFWNLHPTTKSINSSKSNNLPEWDVYFPAFSRLEYFSYEMIHKYDKVHEEFDKCAREHINDPSVELKLYGPGLSYEGFEQRLEELVLPAYKSAVNCGFRDDWVYGK